MAGNAGFEGEMRNVVELALKEDIGPGDITTVSIIPEGVRVEAAFKAKEE